MIRLAAELLNWEDEQLQQTIDNIAVTLGRTFALARAHGLPTSQAADRLAADRLQQPTSADASARPHPAVDTTTQ
jgi:hypothetical protein